MTLLWLEFLFCSALIVYCGTNLSRYGDVIAEKIGLGRAWKKEDYFSVCRGLVFQRKLS
jgi:hypothetical protein